MVAIQGEHRYYEREERKGVSFVLAVLVHGLLALLLLISVQWRTQRPQPVEVEIWSSLPPLAVDQPVVVEPQPEPKIEPVPEPLPTPVEKAPEIVEEKIKPVEKPKQEKPPKPREDKMDAFSKLLNQGVEARNKAEVKPATPATGRVTPKTGGTGVNPAATVNAGTAPMESVGSNKPSSGYKSLVERLIKSNLVYPENKKDKPRAKIRVSLLPDGSIQDAQVLKVIGDPAYAEAARRAVMTTQRFPPQPDGKLFSGESRDWVLSFCSDKTVVECKID